MNQPVPEQLFHEPLSPYISTTYNTLLSVVQGVALGGIFYTLFTAHSANALTWELCIRLLIAGSLIAVLWHRYVIHNQFAVWRLAFQDTAIPFLFAASQFWLVLSLRSDIQWFTGALTTVAAIGSLAYINTVRRYQKPQTVQHFVRHVKRFRSLHPEDFDVDPSAFGVALHHSILSFQRHEIITTFVGVCINGSMTALNIYGGTLPPWITFGGSYVAAAGIILWLWYFDLRWWLNHNAPSLVRQCQW